MKWGTDRKEFSFLSLKNLKIKKVLNKNYFFNLIVLGMLVTVLGSCEKEYLYVTPPPPPKPLPKVAEQTATLEAWFATAPPSTINSAYWKTANYLVVDQQKFSLWRWDAEYDRNLQWADRFQ